jgi:hypothetical protein
MFKNKFLKGFFNLAKNINLKLEDRNIEILNNISKKSKIPITRIINMLINTLDDKSEFLDNNLTNFKADENTEIKIHLTNSEKEFLINQASLNGAKSLSAEVKYRLLNTIYKNKYFTNIELSNFIKTKGEINTIGRNLNQLLKLLHTKSNLTVNDEVFQNMVKDIDNNVKNISNELRDIIEKSRSRY